MPLRAFTAYLSQYKVFWLVRSDFVSEEGGPKDLARVDGDREGLLTGSYCLFEAS